MFRMHTIIQEFDEGGDRMGPSSYLSMVKIINQVTGRQAITIKKLQFMIRKAKAVRHSQGQFGLLLYGKEILQTLFLPREVEMLKRNRQYKPVISKLIQLLVIERVITPTEATKIKKYI